MLAGSNISVALKIIIVNVPFRMIKKSYRFHKF